MSIGIIGAGNIGLAVAKTGGFDNCSFAVQKELCNTIPQKRTLVSAFWGNPGAASLTLGLRIALNQQ